MMRVVIDTSVLIRYLVRPSAAIKELIEVRWLGDQVQMVTAPQLMEELVGVLGRERIQAFIRPEEGQVLVNAVAQKSEMLPALGDAPSFTRDPKDDKFIVCALAGHAEYLVTEDKDLLVLERVGDVRIVTPYSFVRSVPP